MVSTIQGVITSAGPRGKAVTIYRTFTCGVGGCGYLNILRNIPFTHPNFKRINDPSLRRALVVIPTYNERENLPRLIPSVLEQDARLEVLIVDDASPDGTGAIADELAAQEARVHVLHRAGKLGLGTAYLDGFRWGLARDFDCLFEMDADFSHDPAHLPQFLDAIREFDVVLGSRYLHGRVTVVNWPMGRLLLSYFANIYARKVTGLPIADATGGFKCFRREVLEAIPLDQVESNGYAFQIEMSFRAWKKGFRLGEIPIMFVDRDIGESKMSKKIVREAVWRVWRLRWLGLTGRL
jgi:dolichol-phosphate mannosyltransferase